MLATKTKTYGPDAEAIAEQACPGQLEQCKTDNECAQEMGGLVSGARPISAAAQRLVQCVTSRMPRNRLELRSKHVVAQESFGSAVAGKDIPMELKYEGMKEDLAALEPTQQPTQATPAPSLDRISDNSIRQAVVKG